MEIGANGTCGTELSKMMTRSQACEAYKITDGKFESQVNRDVNSGKLKLRDCGRARHVDVAGVTLNRFNSHA